MLAEGLLKRRLDGARLWSLPAQPQRASSHCQHAHRHASSTPMLAATAAASRYQGWDGPGGLTASSSSFLAHILTYGARGGGASRNTGNGTDGPSWPLPPLERIAQWCLGSFRFGSTNPIVVRQRVEANAIYL
ncbi:hypothetical protein PGT21_027075 [Puccinia graminis f. sp. tritici]|uniref:Uncharacterized protein n=1 Tax=Puccinia graminis f. sp. tritici TaxID=56615 RepID=A0A5B0LJR0_PUCGR|nr:hypothetical protein PGTUg99_006490 [Puccinia graminis f. sp. tritici]KAA1099972.1 hypothetical protein PGT21_027075 [Puccinia graminis f. sp. tritici]